MSPHQIIAVAVRLFAVWLVVTTIVTAPSVYAQVLDTVFASTSPVAIVASISILALGIAFILWRFPLTIAGKFLAPPAQESTGSASPNLWLARVEFVHVVTARNRTGLGCMVDFWRKGFSEIILVDPECGQKPARERG